MEKITENTKASDLLRRFPWLADELIRYNERFRALKTPIGRMLIARSTIGDIGKKTGTGTDKIIKKLEELIEKHGS